MTLQAGQMDVPSENKFRLPLCDWLLLLRASPGSPFRLALRILRADLERTFFPRLDRLHRVRCLRRIGRLGRKHVRETLAASRRTHWPEGQEPELAAFRKQLSADEYLARYGL